MAPDRLPQAPGKGQQNAKKRKDAPTASSKGNNDSNKRPKMDHRAKQRDARQLSTQTSGKAFKNGELDVDKFVRAREYEIRALEEGMARSKKALNRRAFQQVPKELRRRTASHNVKRVPKKLQARSKREMLEDNTPTVTARRRKPTRHMRLRLDTAKKLRALGAKRKAEKEKAREVTVTNPNAAAKGKASKPDQSMQDSTPSTIQSRAPRIKKASLAKPPLPKAKFRKRQIHKSWLPTHLFHAKRARMTPPSAPLWRFSIPMTPTAKCYRPTHRASHERGAVAWDVSYMSTIGLDGRQDSLVDMLRALGVHEDHLTGKKGQNWKRGTRVLETFVNEREVPHHPVAPVTITWCVQASADSSKSLEPEKSKRKLFLRVHPSSFYQLWEELLRLAKVAKPEVSVEDLRFEMGSIKITGPGATEALLGALWPSRPPGETEKTLPEAASQIADTAAMNVDTPSQTSIAETWTSLAGLTNPAMLPPNALLGFNVQDPRLHHPPRTINLPTNDVDQSKLLELLAAWPVDAAQRSPELFDRTVRLAASRALPSQKAVNRRKSLAPPGQYPEPSSKDPKVPALLYTTSAPRSSNNTGRSRTHQASWTLLLPWKCVQPIWYSLMYYPLSTGQQPRFGGLDEERQLTFEAGQPWFPADFPGTKAGWEWEATERVKREEEWKRRPKGKRIAWEKVELGGGKKGEIGLGWACEWERLVRGPKKVHDEAAGTVAGAADGTGKEHDKTPVKNAAPPQKPNNLTQMPATQALAILSSASPALPPHIDTASALIAVRLSLLTRGVPQTCARIYRIPSAAINPELRKQWLDLLPSHQPTRGSKGPKHSLPRLPKDAPLHVMQQRLAQSLVEPPRVGEERYPACPAEEDLVGFVTTGNFNLGEGQGTGVGSLLLGLVIKDVRERGEEGRLCVVRNAGGGVARLAKWEVV